MLILQSNTMAQIVKAVRTILEMESVGSLPKQLVNNSFDIEIEDDAPKRKPSLEEIDALEVHFLSHPTYFLWIPLPAVSEKLSSLLYAMQLHIRFQYV